MYSPGGTLNALAIALQIAKHSVHRLQLRLLGYLILFATLAFVSECQLRPSRTPSPPVFLPISTHFTATLGILSAPTELKQDSLLCFLKVKP